MTKENNVFLNEKELMKEIIETLENGFDGCYCDLHNEVFNYGTNTDTEELEEYLTQSEKFRNTKRNTSAQL